MKTLIFSLVTLCLASSADADNIRGHFALTEAISHEQLLPIATDDSHACETPSTPAQILFSKKLRPINFDPTRFFQTPNNSQVTIRRSGQVEDGQSNDSFQASLLDRRPEGARAAEVTDVTINVTLSLCTYESLIDFVDAAYSLTGQIGNFRVDYQRTVEPGPGSEMSISYTGQNWTAHDGGQFLPLLTAYDRNTNAIGLIYLRMRASDVPFHQVDGDAALLLDITTWNFPTVIMVNAVDARP